MHGSATPEVEGNDIFGNINGILVSDSAAPAIMGNEISANASDGIL